MASSLDPEVFSKVEQNRFILGMAEFTIGIVFNTATFFAVLCTGLIKQSTGLYLAFLMAADTMTLITGTIMEEFRNPLIDVDVFSDSDDPLKLCQAMYFMRTMFYYWRWLLMALLVVDRCLFVTGKASMSRLRLVAAILSMVSMLVAGGLAGYWIHWVDTTLFARTNGLYVPGLCRLTPVTAGDNTSVWFYMDTIVHLLLPDLILVLVVFIAGVALLCHLRGKAAEMLEPVELNLSKTVSGLAIVNFVIMVPYIIVNGFILNMDKAFDTYDFDQDVTNNLRYSSRIFGKFALAVLSATFFVLVFSSRFRSFFCKN